MSHEALPSWAVILYVYDDHDQVIEAHGPHEVVAHDADQARTLAIMALLGQRDLDSAGCYVVSHTHALDGGHD